MGLLTGDLEALEKFTVHNLNLNISSEIEVSKLVSYNIGSLLRHVHSSSDIYGNFLCSEFFLEDLQLHACHMNLRKILLQLQLSELGHGLLYYWTVI